ncbi:MAG: hypothetical protein KDC98_10585 [Planctomycetes bacterium]|nr:hypothetical protein [Planctomycetota bacterium]
MNLRLGIVACLLAGCASQPMTRPHDAGDARRGRQSSSAFVAPPTATTTLCLGIECLPPETALAPPEVERIASLPPEAAHRRPTTLVERSRVPEARHTWALSTEDLEAIDNPVARATLQFVDDLVREDRRQTEREVRLPFLDWRPADDDLGQPLWSEESIAEAQQEWLSENGRTLLSRPLRRMLRRLPPVTELELTVDGFRSSCVPLSEPYRKAHGSDQKLGRLSLRLHVDDLTDPAEIVYIRSGIRVGSSREVGKLSLEWPLTDNVSLTVKTRRNWQTAESRIRADLAYRLSPTSSLRLAAGDDMDFLSTSSIYSLFETPMDGSPGLVLYAVHIF